MAPNPARVFTFALAVAGAGAGAASSSLPSSHFLALIVYTVSICPDQIRAPNHHPPPKHFHLAQPAPPHPHPRRLPATRVANSLTHSIALTLAPSPFCLSQSLLHTLVPPATPPTDPVFNPQILSFIPRNQPKSKQFLSQTTARSTKGNIIFCQPLTTRSQSSRIVCASFISYAPFEPCAFIAQALLSFREAFTSPRWALFLSLFAQGDGVSLLLAVDDCVVLWCDANASHQARSVLFATGHIIVTAPATHCTQRRRLGLRPSDASQAGPTPQPAAK